MRAKKADKVFDPMVNGMPRRGAQDVPSSAPTTSDATRTRGAAPAKAKRRGPYRSERSGERTLVETAAAIGAFRSLGRAIRAAGLVDLLSGKGPFTVFAPTDDAFDKLPPGELDRMLADKARMASILSGHIVRDAVAAPRAGTPRAATSMDGAALTIVVEESASHGRGFQVNGARIVKTEIAASNGVIHAIDTVLTPRQGASASTR